MKTERLPLELRKGTKIAVKIDRKCPFTVLYDKSAPLRKRVLGFVDGGDPSITLPRAADVRSLMLLGNVDKKAWQAMKTILDQGGDPGPPGTAGNGNGRI